MSITGEQPAPEPNNGPDMWRQVIADMHVRRAHGIEEYGTPLQPFNSRHQLADAYAEVLDLAVYLRTEIAEREQLAADLRLFFEKLGARHWYTLGSPARDAEDRLREFACTGLPQRPAPEPAPESPGQPRPDLADQLVQSGDSVIIATGEQGLDLAIQARLRDRVLTALGDCSMGAGLAEQDDAGPS